MSEQVLAHYVRIKANPGCRAQVKQLIPTLAAQQGLVLDAIHELPPAQDRHFRAEVRATPEEVEVFRAELNQHPLVANADKLCRGRF
jgi:hypothetical protein